MNTKKYYSRFFLCQKKAFRIFNKNNKVQLTPRQYTTAFVCLILHQEGQRITANKIQSLIKKVHQQVLDYKNLHKDLDHLCNSNLLIKNKETDKPFAVNIYTITPLLLEVCDKMEEVFRLVRWDY